MLCHFLLSEPHSQLSHWVISMQCDELSEPAGPELNGLIPEDNSCLMKELGQWNWPTISNLPMLFLKQSFLTYYCGILINDSAPPSTSVSYIATLLSTNLYSCCPLHNVITCVAECEGQLGAKEGESFHSKDKAMGMRLQCGEASKVCWKPQLDFHVSSLHLFVSKC